MAVGTVRALLVAQSQSVVAQLRHEAGGLGVVAAATPALFAAVAILPPSLMCFTLGVRFGADLGNPALVELSTRGLSWMIAAITLGIGIGGGFGRFGDAFSSEATGIFPIARRALLLSQLIAGAVSPLAALGLAAIASLSMGLVRAAAAPPVVSLAIGIQLALWVLLTQETSAILGRLVLAGRAGFPLAIAILGAAALVIWIGPSNQAVASLVAFARGQPAMAWLRFGLFTASSAIAFFSVTALMSAVDSMRLATRTRGTVRVEWSPSSPVDGVSRLFLDSVRGSRVGRFILVQSTLMSVLLAVVLKILPLGRIAARSKGGVFPSPLVVMENAPLTAIVVVYTALASAPLWLNQFGWYEGGPRRLFLLPVTLREILAGHGRALGRALVLQVLGAFIPMSFVRPPSVPDAAWALATVAALFYIVTGGIGPLVSVQFPRRVTKDAVTSGASLGAAFVPAVMTLLLGGGAAAVYVVAKAAGGVWGPAVAMVPVLALSVLYAEKMKDLVAERVYAQRERLVEDLG